VSKIVVAVGDPPVEDGRFGGKAMTYYGRWGYKYEAALAPYQDAWSSDEDQLMSWRNVPKTSSSERFGARADVQRAGGCDAELISAQTADTAIGGVLARAGKWHELACAHFKPLRRAARARGNRHERAHRRGRQCARRLRRQAAWTQTVMLTAHWDHRHQRDARGRRARCIPQRRNRQRQWDRKPSWCRGRG
jgi:hypothetical protein